VSRAKRVLLWLMSAFYVFGGVYHLVNPGFYLPMMPPYLPWHRELVFVSGVAEIVLGVAVLTPGLRHLAVLGIIAVLIAVFPANLHIAMNDVPLAGAADGAGIWNWVRLPFQALFIAWAWYA
jgi:uncharacterized membrane protein